MISRAMEAEVLRLHHAEHWPIGTIARQLILHHSTVRRVLAQAGVPEAQKTTRPSMADPFIPFMLETLNAYPKLCASRLYIMVRDRGYRGSSDHFRAIVARFRPRPVPEAYLRLRTLAGESGRPPGPILTTSFRPASVITPIGRAPEYLRICLVSSSRRSAL